MTTDALLSALEELADPIFCKGACRLNSALAIRLPDGDVGVVSERGFVDWLVAHAEEAPFGEGGKTKLDKNVRHAKRLAARGRAEVTGFDPARVLGAIEAALSPRMHLDATLEDVILYPEGGLFARHKDTPRTANLVGTLVVGLPIAHQGGQFEIADAGRTKVIDWSGTPDPHEVPWVALFSDVDHAVKPVSGGARVTLVYSLACSDRPRVDATRDKRLAKLRAATSKLVLAKGEPLLIACTRQVITDGAQPQPIETLRGADREIAETLREAGLAVAVRACMVVDEDRSARFPDIKWDLTRLSRAIPADVIAGLRQAVSFTQEVEGEWIEELSEVSTLGEYVLDGVRREHWVIRKRAAATIVYEGMLSDTGYFGNEATFGYLYTLAALEVTSGKGKKKPAAKPRTKAKAKAKTPAKTKAKAEAEAAAPSWSACPTFVNAIRCEALSSR